jgi:hypothetical protein
MERHVPSRSLRSVRRQLEKSFQLEAEGNPPAGASRLQRHVAKHPKQSPFMVKYFSAGLNLRDAADIIKSV